MSLLNVARGSASAVPSPPPALEPWWKTTPVGSEVAVARIKVSCAGAALLGPDLPEEIELKRRARYTAGVEYIATQFGAAQPLSWQGDAVMLTLGGAPAEALPGIAFQAAREVWERVQIELDLPARIAAHVARVRWNPEMATIPSEDIQRCDLLADAAPAGSIVLSEDLALMLPEAAQREITPLGVTANDGGVTYVFPSSNAARREPADLLSEEQRLWAALRRYALGPEVRLVRYVGFRLQKKLPPSLDIRDVFIAPEVEIRARRDPRRRERLHEDPRTLHAAHELEAEPTRAVALCEVFAKHRSAVVLGDPGSGKTTLLRWLAVVAASGRFAASSHLGVSERLLPLPVSVGRLAEIRGAHEDDNPSVPAALARYFHQRGLGEEKMFHALLVQALEEGRCLVLLDGLDEVRAEQRQLIHRWLEAFAAAYPDNRFIASSRVVGYAGFELPDAVEVALRPFDEAQVERYVRAFCLGKLGAVIAIPRLLVMAEQEPSVRHALWQLADRLVCSAPLPSS